MRNVVFSITPWVFLLIFLTGVSSDKTRIEAVKNPEISVSDLKAVQIDSVYGDRSIFTGEEHNYRVRVKPGATWPIKYEWTIAETYKTAGNNIVHKFDKPGKFPLDIVVSNPYGTDSRRIWVWVVDNRNLDISERISKSRMGDTEAKTSTTPRPDADVLPIDRSVPGIYHSWAVETYLNRHRAESAAVRIAKMGLPHVRVYEDSSGSGTPAFRVLVGKYETQRSAISHRLLLEKEIGRAVSLMTIRTTIVTD